jgi:6-phosphogluconolactonase (cycloisomerase 2 family)
MAGPGPVPDRQDVPHLHHTIIDPTKRFMVVPDLGADLLRVYALQKGSIAWTEIDPVVALPGSGPRHGVFATAGPNTFFYVLNELSNTISGYKVTYAPGALKMTRLFDFSSHGPGGSVPAGTKAAELKISVSAHRHLTSPIKRQFLFRLYIYIVSLTRTDHTCDQTARPALRHRLVAGRELADDAQPRPA